MPMGLILRVLPLPLFLGPGDFFCVESRFDSAPRLRFLPDNVPSMHKQTTHRAVPPESRAFVQHAWITTGHEMFACMIEAIRGAASSIRMEMYIYEESGPGRAVLAELAAAALRGVDVQVLVDAFGSSTLRLSFWDPLIHSGGRFHWFNPLSLRSLGIRNHRKLLVVDNKLSIIGGFNIADEYVGDGVRQGWRDLGIRIDGEIACDLSESFDTLFAVGGLSLLPFARLRKSHQRKKIRRGTASLLLCAPGRGRGEFERELTSDINAASDIQIVAAYFLPPPRVRWALRRAAIRGARVRIILPSKSDVPVSQLASRSYYQSLMRVGIELFEYQPQILHAKLVILDNAVHVGSANLDRRSFRINYELMVRFDSPEVAEQARNVFEDMRSHSKQVDPLMWRKSRGFFDRLKERWAHFLLATIDPLIARRQLRTLK